MSELTSIVFFFTLNKPLLLGEMVDVKALSELGMSCRVNLSDEDLFSHIFQNFSSLFIFGVRLVCVEVN